MRVQVWPQYRAHDAHSFLLGWMVLPNQLTIYLVVIGIAVSW